MSVKMPDVFEDTANAVTLTGSHWFLKKTNGAGYSGARAEEGREGPWCCGTAGLGYLGGKHPVVSVTVGNSM